MIGRRAYDRRNNLKLDCLDRVTYVASSLAVFMERNTEKGVEEEDHGDISDIKQTFIRPEKNRFEAISPEISAF